MKELMIILLMFLSLSLFGQMMHLADTPPSGGGGITDEQTYLITADIYDQEERIGCCGGAMEMASSDLEILAEGGTDEQMVILQYVMTIPQGATINSAYIQFTKDSGGSGTSTVRFQAEDVDNATELYDGLPNGYVSDIVAGNTTSPTTAYVDWNINVSGWNSDAAQNRGANQLTPDLSPVIQEIVDRPGWSSGNRISILMWAVVLGEVEAESFNGGGSSEAPQLTVNFTY